MRSLSHITVRDLTGAEAGDLLDADLEPRAITPRQPLDQIG
ncbi:MAG: hypothetical protein ACRDT4_03325 [Micromonosporaceae bacterium]